MKKKHLYVLVFALISGLLPIYGLAEGPGDPAEVEAFLDGIMAAHLESYHIAGAVVAIVKDGQLFLAKGYGYADVDKNKPVKADKTLFRIGSTSKLFTWTAVMQLVEKGQLDLDADVNTYLKTFKIPPTFAQPITMKHLMTHTPGFEDRFTGMAVKSPKDIPSLADSLVIHLPARVRPPGQLTAYSNYGVALAGHIVELVSGMPFETYIEENIYKPLGMTQSSFRQSLPAPLLENMSVGYTYENGEFKVQEFELFRGLTPAGSMSCTAADIARFMIAQLNLGEWEGRRILGEETAKIMHSRLFSNDEKTAGNAHGFWEYSHNNLYILEHGGDTIYFHTLLALVPEKNLGFFVSYNTQPDRNPRAALFKAFLDRYYPALVSPLAQETAGQKDKAKNPDPEKGRLVRFTGDYAITRASATTYEKFGLLFGSTNVCTTEKNRLLINSRQWVQIESLKFKELNGQDTIVFREDARGRITHMFFSWVPHAAFIKLAGAAKPGIHYLVSVLCIFLFLTTWRWPLSALFNKLCRRKSETVPAPSGPAKRARLLAWLMANAYLLGLFCLLMSADDGEQLIFGVTPLLKITLLLPLVGLVLTIGVLVFAVLAWKNKYWLPCQRLHYTLLVIASLAFLWFLNYWNLIGMRY